MQGLATKKSDISILAPKQIEGLILDTLGLKVEVKRLENSTLILVKCYQSCFRIMEKLHWDFDFSVHKKNKIYIVEI